MDLEKVKGMLVLVIGIIIIGAGSFFAFSQYYKPIMTKQLEQQAKNEYKFQPVVVATKDISMGSIVTSDCITIKPVPKDNTLDASKLILDSKSIIGKVAISNIYANEQIVVDKLGFTSQLSVADIEKLEKPEEQKLDPSDRYITIDIPKYNFVNGSVTKGSLVDILVDKGQGIYDVVLAKVTLEDIKEVGAPKATTGSAGNDNSSVQLKRPLPKPVYKPDDSKVQNMAQSTRPQLMIENNIALDESQDCRVTIKASELEQKRVYEAMTYGKLMTRAYVLPTQAKSVVTFKSLEEKNMNGKAVVEGQQNKAPKVTVKPTSTTDINTNH